MKANKYKGILFDMDGTLLYTAEDMTTAVNLTLAEFGYPTRTLEEVTSYVNNGAYRLVELALPEDARDESNVKRVLERYLYHYGAHVCERTRPYEGIPELVADLKKAGYRLGIVSNKPDAQAKALAAHFFGDGVFSYVSGSGEGLPVKPDKACVERALAALGLTAEETLYVGDSYVDVLTARNAGLYCIGVLWGFGGEHSFDRAAPDCTVRSCAETALRFSRSEPLA